jgi:hypothetical protein
VAVEDAYELAYREAVRALEHQRAEATGLQTRAGMLLAAASISISLLGRDAFDALHALAWLGVLCFALLSLCVLAIVWPYADQDFIVDPQALLAARLAGGTPDAAALSVELIGLIGVHHRINGRRLARMSKAFHIGACLLVIQLVLTVLAAAVTV